MVKVIQEDLNSVSRFLCKISLLSITWLTSGPGSLVATSGCVIPAGSARDTEPVSVLEGFCALTKLGEAFSLLGAVCDRNGNVYIIRPRYIFMFLRAGAQPATRHRHMLASTPRPSFLKERKVLRLHRNQRATAASMPVLSGVQHPTA